MGLVGEKGPEMERVLAEGVMVETRIGRGWKSETVLGEPFVGMGLVGDQTPQEGGTGEGPGPFQYLYTALTQCVVMTIRSYADRKEWPVEGATARLFVTREGHGPVTAIEMEVEFEGDLDADQIKRLRQISEACPVHKTLSHGIAISLRD